MSINLIGVDDDLVPYIDKDEIIRCQECDSEEVNVTMQIQRNGRRVLMARCALCNTFIKYLPQLYSKRSLAKRSAIKIRDPNLSAKWAYKVKKRDKLCFICGDSEELEAHHIIPVFFAPELEFNTNNGITLCKKHHHMIHESYKKYKGVD